MSGVTRYELDDWDKSLQPCGNGSWVTFDAYSAVVAERDALARQVRALAERATWYEATMDEKLDVLSDLAALRREGV